MKDTKKASKAKQPVKVFENDDYSISTIPLNYHQVQSKVTV
jgi:hypothetical protein